MSFVRRFSSFPSVEQITQIEGAVIIDLPPPGSVTGVGVGTVGLVGEFQDVTYGVSVDPTTGIVTTKTQPTEVFSAQDLINKFGGFDETLGDFGGADGNGFVSLRNKKFSRLVIGAINNASSNGTRLWRTLPTNTSATIPIPVVPMQAASVAAGREFKLGNDKVRTAARVLFGGDLAEASGTDGITAVAAAAATQLFKIGVEVIAGGVVRVASTVTVTVANTFVAGQVVYLAPGEANFPAGAKVVVTAAPGSFTYTEAGAAVANAVTERFSNFDFTALAQKGDAIVLGVLSAAGAQGTNADTYRIVSVTNANQLSVEKQSGVNFAFLASTAMTWRLHAGTTADTGLVHPLSEVGGYLVPSRPLTDGTNTGSSVADGTITAGAQYLPSVNPPAATATTWDVLSGLTMGIMPGGGGGLAFTAAIQKPNPGNATGINTLYGTAIDGFLSEDLPARDVNIMWGSRTSRSIANKLRGHVDLASSQGVGRIMVTSPGLGTTASTGTQSVTTVLGSASGASTSCDMGVASPDSAGREERVIFDWPGVITSIPEAANIAIKTALGTTTLDGILDQRSDGWMACVLSNLVPERNPGQQSQPIPSLLSAILGLQRGVVGLGIGEYTAFKQNGIAAPKIDRDSGPIFQSGKTTSLTEGQKNINRRRMADFIQDSLARRYAQLSKELETNAFKDAVVTETDAFLEELLSPDNPPAQRIKAYSIDDKSGNTPDLEAKGIFIVISRVQSLATADFIVAQTSIGEGVDVNVT